MENRELYFDHDGIALHCCLEFPENAPEKLPLVILQHGLTGHMEERHIIAIKDGILETGYAVLRTELFGHGKSGGEFSEHTVLKWVSEMLAIIRYARSLPFVSRLYLSGHSQGGLTALLCGGMAADELDGLLLLSPAVNIRDGCRDGNFLGFGFDPADIPDMFSYGDHTYSGDYIRAARCLPVEDCVDAFEKPVFLLHGDEDDAVPYACSERLLQRYANAKLERLVGDDHCYEKHLAEAVEYVKEFMRSLSE